jgi:predicted nucleic acid-binding protein
MPRYIFVNTSAWLALYNPNDPNHNAAKEFWSDLREQPVRFVTTDYVMEQVYTALKVFGSLQTAQAFGQLLDSSNLMRPFMVDSVIFDRAWKVFLDDEHPEWTFTDCINFAVVQYLGLSEVFTFDPNFTAPGMQRMPSTEE